MKITDSPGAIVEMPCNSTADPNEFELSSIFHPVISAGAVPMFVTSNQSTRSGVGLLPLDHGATSVMTTDGVPPVDAVTVNAYPTLASGELPTVGSSTLTVTL